MNCKTEGDAVRFESKASIAPKTEGWLGVIPNLSILSHMNSLRPSESLLNLGFRERGLAARSAKAIRCAEVFSRVAAASEQHRDKYGERQRGTKGRHRTALVSFIAAQCSVQ